MSAVKENPEPGLPTVNKALVAMVRANVRAVLAGGKTPEQALELAASALAWADQLVERFEAENPLPRPLVCQAGCYYCCHNQVELTPPEALLLGHYVEEHFSGAEKADLKVKVAGVLKIKAGKNKAEIARIRQELPCPLLREARCAVYPLRPLLCRAMHSLEAGECEASLKRQDLADSAFYPHRYEIIRSISQGLREGSASLGCQSGALDLAAALHDFFREPDPIKRWIKGEKVFGG